MWRRLVVLVVLVGQSACGGDSAEQSVFVQWATEQGGLERMTAECVEPKLSASERDALVSIEPDAPESEIDADAVDAMVAASAECFGEPVLEG